ncbi:hypothetical protein GCM10027423_61600 [Spirosoma arcticum]
MAMTQAALYQQTPGITFRPNQPATVSVWAPFARQVALSLQNQETNLPLTKDDTGYWQLTTDQISPGDLYTFLLDDELICVDPASRAQPQGVFGPSQAVNLTTFYWEDSCWVNPPLDEYITYELDIENFIPEGTFKGVSKKLGYLKKLGVNAIAIRPLATMGNSDTKVVGNVFLYAVSAAYGGPAQLQHLINACHYAGIAVLLELDVSPVGHRGDFFSDFRTDRSRRQRNTQDTSPDSQEVQREAGRRYVSENALMWLRDFHADALRLNGLISRPDTDLLLRSIRERVDTLSTLTGRQYYLLAEDTSAPKVSADWPYANFLLRTYHKDYLYDQRFYGILQECFDRPPHGPISCLSRQRSPKSGHSVELISTEVQKLTAGAIMVSPHIPTLFMGDKWDPANLFGELVQPDQEGAGAMPVLPDSAASGQPTTAILYRYYHALTALRRQQPALHTTNQQQSTVINQPGQQTVLLHRWHNQHHVLCLMNFAHDRQSITTPSLGTAWQKLFDSADPEWLGPGASPDSLPEGGPVTLQPESIVVYKACL